MPEAGCSKQSQKPVTKSSFDVYNVELQKAALGVTKVSMGLPIDIDFHRSVDSNVAESLDACADRVLRLTNTLLGFIGSGDSSSKSGVLLETNDDVTDRFSSVVVDAVDSLLERADICLDNYSGRSKPAAIAINAPAKAPRRTTNTRQGPLDPGLTHASQLPKPQLKFTRKSVNSTDNVWRPSLRHKYNAQIPLGYNLTDAEGDVEMASQPKTPHPYRHEIKNITYPDRLLKHAEAVPPKTFEETPFTWIDTKDGLHAMLDKLRLCDEIAVDLEHHSYRTFSGFLCLMQISTRQEDFIVDVLVLRDELEELNEVFTDPKITKVLHGAESDIVWLQQDFNIYVVNLFDTYHASKALQFPRHGLAALLSMYCDYVADKRYQLADWRIRPLPQETVDYARSDTHYLLYIYDNLRNALLDRDGGEVHLLRTVLDRSEDTALRIYEQELYDFENGSGPSGWATLAQKWNKALTGSQMAIFRAAHAWRDKVAREEDESTNYVLANHYLLQLAERPPTDMTSLFAKFRSVPPLIRTRAQELLNVIRNAIKEQVAPANTVNDSSVSVQTGLVVQTVAQAVALPPAESQSAIVVAVVPAESSQVHDLSRLWSFQQKVGQTLVSASSSLLDVMATSSSRLTAQNSSLLSSQSTLFPMTSMTILSPGTNGSARYRDAVARIHSALVIAPTVPSALPDAEQMGSASTEQKEIEPSVPEQIEIPFVPASQRKPIAPEIDDTIVVVGKRRTKKRKRDKAQEVDDDSKESTPSVLGEIAATSEGGVEKKKAKKRGKNKGKAKAEDEDNQAEEPLEPFDYSSVPNILDDHPVEQALPLGTLRKQPRKGDERVKIDYGNFGRAPKNPSDVKGGNKSYTFR